MWLQIDEGTDVLVSLAQCLSNLRATKGEPAHWKWVIFSLHNAFQGAIVCHLSGTAQAGALTERSAKEWMEWHERDRRGEIRRIQQGTGALAIPRFTFVSKKDHPPADRLADAAELFKRLYDEKKRLEEGAGALLDIGESQRKSFRQLHHLRNEFAHFSPKGWSLETAGLPAVFLDVLQVADMIAADPWPFRHLEAQERGRLNGLLRDLRSVLNETVA